MTAPVSLIARLMIIVSTLFWALLLIVFLLGLPLLLAISPKVAGAFAAAALILALVITWVIRVAAYTQSIRPFFFVLAKPFLLLLFTLVGLATLPVFYLAYKAEVDSPELPRVEISNGEKTIVFQGMIHVGNKQFFNTVTYDAHKALDAGYKIFYEHIKPSNPDADNWFATTAVGHTLNDEYKAMAKVCDINFQPNYFQLIPDKQEQNPEQYLNADVDTAQLKSEFDRLMQNDNAFAFSVKLDADKSTRSFLMDYVDDLVTTIKRYTEGQPKVANIICAGTFAILLDTDRLSEGPLNKLILNIRNKHLADAILTDASSKNYVIYGAAHLPGLLALLREADPRWDVKSRVWLQDVTHPNND